MKFKEYVMVLSEYLRDNPQLEDVEVAYFSDDEGNHLYQFDLHSPLVQRVQSLESIQLEPIHNGDLDEDNYTDYPIVVIIN